MLWGGIFFFLRPGHVQCLRVLHKWHGDLTLGDGVLGFSPLQAAVLHGHLPAVMQLYWHQPGSEYGTGFYRYHTESSLIHQFTSDPNTGYIMLNHLDPDGNQPLQWHAMLNPVPDGTYRLSSYWHFET